MKVLDFGLAKMRPAGGSVDSELPTEAQTREGVVMGTVPYMSPEQVSGRPVDHRTDIFSLGVVLYEMASGRRPFEGRSTAEVLASAILRDTPPALTTLRARLPEELIQIVTRCLEKDPGARFQGMRDVHGALQVLPAGGSGRQTAAGHGPGSGSHALKIAGGAAILLGVAAYLVARSGVMRPASHQRQAATQARGIRSIAVLPLDNYSGESQPGALRRRDDRRADGGPRQHQPASSDLPRLGDAVQGRASAADP